MVNLKKKKNTKIEIWQNSYFCCSLQLRIQNRGTCCLKMCFNTEILQALSILFKKKYVQPYVAYSLKMLNVCVVNGCLL